MSTKKEEKTVNSVYIVGNVGQDPIVRTLSSGMNVLIFSIATSENRRQSGEKTEWHPIRVYTNNLMSLLSHLKKGIKLYVEGCMHYFSYTDNNGNKTYSFYIDATNIMLGILKKRPIDLYNTIRLRGVVSNLIIETKDVKEPSEEGDKHYILARFKIRTLKELETESGLKTYHDDHSIRGIVNLSALSDIKTHLKEGSEITLNGRLRYISNTDENTELESKVIRKNVIVDMYDILIPVFEKNQKCSINSVTNNNGNNFSDDQNESGTLSEEMPF